MGRIIGFLCSIVFLILASIPDIKWKVIPKNLILTGGFLGFLYQLSVSLFGEDHFHILRFMINTVDGLLPGFGLLLLAFATKKGIGIGDGLMLMVLGLFEGGALAWKVLLWGLFLQSIFAIILLVLRKAGRNTKIPFIPFLLAGRVVISCL